jgi:hypothetical protein
MDDDRLVVSMKISWSGVMAQAASLASCGAGAKSTSTSFVSEHKLNHKPDVCLRVQAKLPARIVRVRGDDAPHISLLPLRPSRA